MKRYLSILILVALFVPLVAFASSPARTREHDAAKESPTATLTETSEEVLTEAPADILKEVLTESPSDVLEEVLTEVPMEDEPVTSKKRISEMNDQELAQFLEEYMFGYESYSTEDKDLCLKFFKMFIDDFDSDSITLIPLNASIYYAWGMSIDDAVEKYYGIIKKDCCAIADTKASYTPQQNVFWQIPNNMGNFNCYGYGVDLRVLMQPGFSSDAVYNLSTVSISTLANHVKNDLQSSHLDQDCVRITTNRPDASILSSGLNAICIRKGSSSAGVYDYHVMKLTNNGWLHKPGQTAIIKHTKTLSPTTPWYSEGTSDGITWVRSDINYTGPIYYIIYRADHSYSVKYTGQEYHSGDYHYFRKAYVCNNCGASYGAYYEKIRCNGSPCITPNDIADNTHNH